MPHAGIKPATFCLQDRRSETKPMRHGCQSNSGKGSDPSSLPLHHGDPFARCGQLRISTGTISQCFGHATLSAYNFFGFKGSSGIFFWLVNAECDTFYLTFKIMPYAGIEPANSVSRPIYELCRTNVS
uniref:Uncharacterized protein n=1 Tax=Haemonchus contortus TaxID=6289 RepID=A0A7I4XTM5_HAECO